ncbi:GNAT family N-acetyltransferase [Haloarcula sp. GH36]|uniref:GNAT family N-acetyltransferase n=1 Tax=Haloarcula montana TaxID=3111776 RepID=UPI002D77AFEE|nr:GNAT family N-acetyltransferase [Haloarcula sp. GH36]
MSVSFRSLDPDRTDEWGQVLSHCQAGTAFHTLAWKRAIARSLQYTPAHRVGIDSTGEIIALVPGFSVPEISGRTIVNPFCEYGYPLVNGKTRTKPLLEELESSLGRSSTLILKESPLSGISGYYPTGYAGIRTGVAFRLSTAVSYESLRETKFNADLRSSLRDATTYDLELRERNALDAYYPLYLQTMRRLGSPQFSRAFFEALLDEFDQAATVLVLESAGESVAGVFYLDYDGTRHVLSNASDPDHWEKHPNEYLYAEIIRRACEGECTVVDFGRTERDSSLFEFKTKFGGTVFPLISFVTPPHNVRRASVSQYKRLEPLSKRLAPLLTHPTVGPRVKRWIHE